MESQDVRETNVTESKPPVDHPIPPRPQGKNLLSRVFAGKITLGKLFGRSQNQTATRDSIGSSGTTHPDSTIELSSPARFSLSSLCERFYGKGIDKDTRDDLLFYTQELLQEKTWAEIELMFINSKRFEEKISQQRKQSTHSTLQLLYHTILERNPDDVGEADYTTRLQNDEPTTTIIQSFTKSEEYRKHLISLLYTPHKLLFGLI